MGYNCVSLILTILLVVITWPVVYGNDATPILQNKNRIEQWFNNNVPSQNGRGDFKTLTEAINSVPVGNKERVIIKLGHGEYKEKEQALSMRISGNKATFYNCKLYGYQDTICDDTGNHFFKDCYIEGTFDFIFGSGRSLYLSTQLNVVGDGLRVITAHAGKSTEEKSGYSFVHCKVTGTGTGIYLGRAWMSHPKVVYAYTDMSSVVNPTVFYGEYKCSGPGSRKEKKVKYTQDIDNI
ncbi:hypothetical protein BRARA_A02243 [Brassica rapa]|uniref:pectinesterase n=1 Tax=Brassica campestris TaxID=3711 RepID=A0A398AV72_BRACM|nr:hypothetical protein BRARA_A02243 [Brassica rapa]